MDSQSKTGKVYLQPRRAGKKWKPVWLSLFPPSSSGVGRLEIRDMGGDGGGDDHGTAVRRHHLPHGDRKVKVVRLSELISVLRLPPNAEACPMENMSAFCMETHDRTMVFAALKDECVEWVEKLCHSTFQRGGGSRSTPLQMEENQIYASAEAVSEFWVAVQRTDAAIRCGLQGSYWLQVGLEALLLRDPQMKNIVREWPYELLRRYGKEELTFTIEAGRRCNSGPGTFNFETQQAEKIFSLIQSTIKRKQTSTLSGNQNQEGEKVGVTIRAHSPLPKIPDMGAHVQGDLIGQSDCASVYPPPITLMPLPSIPTNNSHFGSHHSDPSDAVYANPAECISSIPKPQRTTAVYVDPACVLPLKPCSSREAVAPSPNSSTPHPFFNIDHPDSGYSEVYDKISPVQNKKTVLSKGETMCSAEEPIYTVPMHQKDEVSHKNITKSDLFAHLYAQVCKTAPSSKPSPSTISTTPTPSCSASSVTVTDSTATTKDMDQTLFNSLPFMKP